MRTRPFFDHVLVALGAGLALIGALAVTRPVFVGRAPVVQELLSSSASDSIRARSPWIAVPASLAMQSPRFLADRQAFAADLVRTGKVGRERAWEIADVAVREAYTRKVPPALVLGVMLTENDEFRSAARSSVGAVGLMQVAQRPWRGLGKLFGTNLHADSTNLKYGIFILGYLTKKVGVIRDIEQGWRTALLQYNGCARGTNTPGCGSYPDVVRRNVVSGAKYSCAGLDFTACVADPLWLANRSDAP